MASLNAVDLFAGAGGLSLGLEEAGFTVKVALESSHDAGLTYTYNHPDTTLLAQDIRKTRGKQILGISGYVDLLAGGPPCQGFSHAGERRIDDPRNTLIFELIRLVKELKPGNVLIENVPGLKTFQNGAILKKAMADLVALGYYTSMRVFDAADFFVPQSRKRIFILGSKNGFDLREIHVVPRRVTVSESLEDLAFLNAGEKATEYARKPNSKYQRIARKKSGMLHNHEASKHSPTVLARFSRMKPGETARDLPVEVQTRKRFFSRLKADAQSPTVTTLPDDFLHYSKDRILTVREVARLQSFPDDYVFLGSRTTGGSSRKKSTPQYTQVGNAVPPGLASTIAWTVGQSF